MGRCTALVGRQNGDAGHAGLRSERRQRECEKCDHCGDALASLDPIGELRG
jgi:hypothetical protein